MKDTDTVGMFGMAKLFTEPVILLQKGGRIDALCIEIASTSPLTGETALRSKHIANKVCDKNTYPFRKLNDATV